MMKKPIVSRSKLFSIVEEIRELYRTMYELSALIRDTDPGPRIEKMCQEQLVLDAKISGIKEKYEQLQSRTNAYNAQRYQAEKRLKLLKNRKKINQLLALAKKANA